MIKCFFENGEEAIGGGLRHVTTVVMVVDDVVKPNRILLTKRAATMSSCPGLWAFPGGFLDRDESIRVGARREVEEESGYTLKGELRFLQYDDNPERGDDRQNVVFVWLGEAGEIVKEKDAETEEVKWWDLKNLPERSLWAFNHFDYIQWLNFK